jgi:hypothetical protein
MDPVEQRPVERNKSVVRRLPSLGWLALMRHQAANLSLWIIAMVTTFLVVPNDRITILGPVFAVCIIGSVISMRAAVERAEGARTERRRQSS